MHRFFVSPGCIKGRHATLQGDVVSQISRVLRMSPGDEVALLDNSGKEYRVRLSSFRNDQIEGDVVSVVECQGECETRVTLYQSMLKGDKFQWVLEKGTELGVSAFVPLICQRAVPRQRDRWHTSRYPRWRKIVAEAAEQSGRCVLPEVREPIDFQEACEKAKGQGVSIIPWEREQTQSLRSLLGDIASHQVNIFIGPEGGFEDGEVAYARSCGIVPVSLGKRILRSETASIVAVAAVLY